MDQVRIIKLDFIDISKFYSYYQITRSNRKKINQISLDFVFNLNRKIFNPLLDKYIKLLLAVGFKENLDHHLSKTLTFELLELIQTSHDFELELLHLNSEKKRLEILDRFFTSILDQPELFKPDGRYQS